MSVSGIIFSNLHDKNIPELTRMRTMASVPFGCRYRLIDFALSNMVNSGITDIRVIIHKNYRSLMDHLGSGKDWDLARRTGGLQILPPYVTSFDAGSGDRLYRSRLEALMGVVSALSHIKSENVVLSDCDIICNIDLNAIVAAHERSKAAVTMVVKETEYHNETANGTIVDCDEAGNITDLQRNPRGCDGVRNLSTNIMVINTELLRSFVSDSIAHGYMSFTQDVLLHNLGHYVFRVYKYEGVFKNICSLNEYFDCNMALLRDKSFRDALLNVRNRPILTKVRNSAPTRYIEGCRVRDSLIADGCTIEGTVENSILFRGVRVGKGTIVRNSILYQDVYTGENVFLNCVIADKNAVIRDSVMLSGYETLPFYIEKGKMV